MLYKLAITLSVLLVSACSISPNQGSSAELPYNRDLVRTVQYYDEALRQNPVNKARLNLFFTKMPKGGDLHHHFSGSIYAETYLDWVEKNPDLRIDQCTLRIVDLKDAENNAACPLLTVSELLKDNASYRKLLTLWSDKDYGNHNHIQPAPDTNFFNTFGYFARVSGDYSNMEVGLNILKRRALAENVSYIETMLSTVKGISGSLISDQQKEGEISASLIEATSYAEVRSILDVLLSDDAMKAKVSSAVDDFVTKVECMHKGRELIPNGAGGYSCGANSVYPEIDCRECGEGIKSSFVMRYQTYGVRTLAPLDVFMDLYASYLAAARSDLIVGVNIVAPENDYVALRDYELHMQFFKYLNELKAKEGQICPSGSDCVVNRALHAGELTIGMVRPKDLEFHIDQAINIAGAQRVGHGIDLPYENRSLQMLSEMKRKGKEVAVEINLTSNEFILGVEKGEHPYQIYANNKVPMIISTDDSGVSRNNLTNEYVLLASRYKPDYLTIKSYVYNSIKYSFLSEEEKVEQQAILDRKFAEFESSIARLTDSE